MTAGEYTHGRKPPDRAAVHQRSQDSAADSSMAWDALRPILEEYLGRRREDSEVRTQPMANAVANLIERIDARDRREAAARIAENEEHDRRMRSVKVWAGAVGTVVSALVGLTGYTVATAPQKPTKEQVQTVASDVEKASDKIQERVRATEERTIVIETMLRENHHNIEGQIRRSHDGFTWLGAKIDTMSPRNAGKNPAPKSLIPSALTE